MQLAFQASSMNRHSLARSRPSGDDVSLEPSTVPVPISTNGALITLPGSSHGGLPSTRVASNDAPQVPVLRSSQGLHVQAGDWIGGVYQIQEKLGGGAMGQVFAAFDDALERKVAIKLI